MINALFLCYFTTVFDKSFKIKNFAKENNCHDVFYCSNYQPKIIHDEIIMRPRSLYK